MRDVHLKSKLKYTKRARVDLFDASRAIPQMASAHIQQGDITFSAYNYIIEYKPGQCNSNADALIEFCFLRPCSIIVKPCCILTDLM